MLNDLFRSSYEYRVREETRRKFAVVKTQHTVLVLGPNPRERKGL